MYLFVSHVHVLNATIKPLLPDKAHDCNKNCMRVYTLATLSF